MGKTEILVFEAALAGLMAFCAGVNVQDGQALMATLFAFASGMATAFAYAIAKS